MPPRVRPPVRRSGRARRPRLAIERIWPTYAIPGGRLDIGGRGFTVDQAPRLRVFFGEEEAHIYRVSSTRLGIRVPEAAGEDVRVCLNDRETDAFHVTIGRLYADDLHIVANPVYDPQGNLYSTVSGRRGEKIPHPIYRLVEDGDPEPLGDGIVNPTGLAWGPDDTLYVSSREDGRVYRMGDDGVFHVLAEDLGCATGIGFSPTGDLVIGDREGTLYRVDSEGEVGVFSHLRASISAYHLAFNSLGYLFVSGPTLSSRDQIVEFRPDGEPCRVHSGFGRPQGIAFDDRDRCFVAEGLAGDAGLFLFTPTGARRVISAPPLIGVALSEGRTMAVATSDSIYEFDLDRALLREFGEGAMDEQEWSSPAGAGPAQ